jgi:hypothetical protein
MARFYLDEDLANFVAPLRDDGHDLLFAGEAGARRPDPWHLQRASVEGRIFLTFNERDFRYLHRLWTSLRAFAVLRTDHGGILTATAQLEPRVLLPALRDLLAAQQELKGRMLVWHPARQEWREDRWRPQD